jgi:serine/threonine protein kinase
MSKTKSYLFGRYLVMEHLETNLHSIIATKNLDYHFIKYFLYQILRGLKVRSEL